MQDKETGEMFVGSQVREKLGLQPQTEKGGVNEKLYAKDAKEFRIFVQSTSVNRKLIGGTTFLYEISDIMDTGTVIEEVKHTVTTEKKAKKPEERELIITKGESAKTEHEMYKATTAEKSETATEKSEAVTEKDETATEKAKTVEVVEVIEHTASTETVKTAKSKKTKSTTAGLPKFSSLSTECITAPVVDESKTVVRTKDTTKEDIKVAKKINEAAIKGFKTGSERVLDGLNRFETSQNKKNTEYLVNNLKKSIAAAQKILDSIQ